MDSEKQYLENLSDSYDTSSRALYKTTTDDERLAELGHVQELKRTFSVWSLTCLCLCLMATWEALGSVLALALISGGAPCLFYN
jgi:choline transport protein